MRVAALLVALLLVTPNLTTAQTAAPPFEPSLRASAALELAARRARTPGMALRVADDVLAPLRRGKQGEGETLMIIGGAAVLVGAIAGGGGGEVLIVGGLVCAGYGLYLYNQNQ
jgi:hypothetical protein